MPLKQIVFQDKKPGKFFLLGISYATDSGEKTNTAEKGQNAKFKSLIQSNVSTEIKTTSL